MAPAIELDGFFVGCRLSVVGFQPDNAGPVTAQALFAMSLRPFLDTIQAYSIGDWVAKNNQEKVKSRERRVERQKIWDGHSANWWLAMTTGACGLWSPSEEVFAGLTSLRFQCDCFGRRTTAGCVLLTANLGHAHMCANSS
jgi:hypothetical protein